MGDILEAILSAVVGSVLAVIDSVVVAITSVLNIGR